MYLLIIAMTALGLDYYNLTSEGATDASITFMVETVEHCEHIKSRYIESVNSNFFEVHTDCELIIE